MYTNATSALLECDICFKLLANKINLQIHMKIHTGDYPFICKFCGKGFLHHTSHRLHVNTHERDQAQAIDQFLATTKLATNKAICIKTKKNK